MMSVKNDVNLNLKVKALEAAILKITGEKPVIYDRNDHYYISWTEKQRNQIQEYVKKRLQAKPSDIRLDFVSTVLPPILEVYGKYIFLGGMALFLLGRARGKNIALKKK